jgi:tetratricopeptide (TPR) repeat protein
MIVSFGSGETYLADRSRRCAVRLVRGGDNGADVKAKMIDGGNTAQKLGRTKTEPRDQANSDSAYAYFRMGETYYTEKKYEDAILAYENFIKKYPSHDKAKEAMLKQAYAFIWIGDKKTSKVILEQVIQKYPQSAEADLAKKKLEELLLAKRAHVNKMATASTQGQAVVADSHPTELVGEWTGIQNGTTWTFRLKADGTATVIEMTSNGSTLYQEGPWRVSNGTLFYDMESQHKSTTYKLESSILSIYIENVVLQLHKKG